MTKLKKGRGTTGPQGIGPWAGGASPKTVRKRNKKRKARGKRGGWLRKALP